MSLDSIDHYLEELFRYDDPVISKVEKWLEESPHPNIAISRRMGRLLYLFAKIQGAKKILEVGTLYGISGIYLARALPEEGQLITIERGPKSAAIARRSFALAGLQEKVEVLVGDAKYVLPQITETFDLLFFDADKSDYPTYLELALPKLRPGGVLLADNVLIKEKPLSTSPQGRTARGLAQFNHLIANHPQLESIILPTLEEGEIDGLAICKKKEIIHENR